MMELFGRCVLERECGLFQFSFSPYVWIGLILRRKCVLKHVIKGKIKGRIEVMGRRGRRCKLLYDLMETRGRCKLKEEALDYTLWRTRFGRGCGPVVRPTRVNSVR
jgi:hypothetical protein